MEELRGKVVLLDFWATWCPPCREMLPVLQDLHERHRGQGLAVVGVTLDRAGPDVVQRFVQDHGVGYTVGFPGQKLMSRYGAPRQIPTLLVLDRRGRLVETLVGVHRRERIDAIVQPLLQDPPPASEPAAAIPAPRTSLRVELGTAPSPAELDPPSGEAAPIAAPEGRHAR